MHNPIVLEPYTAEDIAPGVVRAWSADRRLVRYTVDDVKRPTAIAWTDSVKALGLAWPSGQPMRVLYVIRTVGNLQMASFVGTRLSDINEQPVTASKIIVALVMPSAMLAGAARVIGMGFSLSVKSRIPFQIEAFSDVDPALFWLVSQPD